MRSIILVFILSFGSACAAESHVDFSEAARGDQGQTMEPDTVVANFIGGVDEGDIDGAFALVSDDVSWWVPGDLPFSGTKTKAEYMVIVNQIQSGFPDGFEMKLLETTTEGGRVAAEVESFGVHRNGRTYNNKYHFLFVVEAGQIVQVKEYMDTLHLAQLISPQ